MMDNKAKKQLKKIAAIFGPTFFVLLFCSFFFFRGSIWYAEGVGSDNVGGYAWSSNYGWISMNCTNDNSCNAGHDYGVKIYGASGNSYDFNLDGYAWSPNAGWISFRAANPPDNYSFNANCKKTCNSSNNCTACFNPDTGRIYGWAKVINLGNDGWMSLSATGTSPGVYIDQTVASGTFYGYGWNSDSAKSKGLGWVSFSCGTSGAGGCASTNYQVYLRNHTLPSPSGLSAPNWPFASACGSLALNTVLAWNNTNYNPTAYQIIFSTNNSTTTSPYYDTGKRSATNPVSFAVSSSNVLITGKYDTPFYWFMRVWDDFGFISHWRQFNTASGDTLTDNVARNSTIGNSKTFTTYKHEMPTVHFTYIPTDPLAYYPVTSTVSSYYYTSASPASNAQDCGNTNCSYLWAGSSTLSNLTPTASSTVMTFRYTHGAKIKITVTDLDNYSCSSSTPAFFVDLLPVWKEKKAQ
jgi:hypothetical protein